MSLEKQDIKVLMNNFCFLGGKSFGDTAGW